MRCWTIHSAPDTAVRHYLDLEALTLQYKQTPPVVGTILAACRHKQMLFEVQDCLRHDKSKCLTSNSPFYAVTSNGLDAMMMRLAEEAKQMSVFNSTVLGPDSEG